MRSRDHLVPFPGAEPGTCVHCGRPTAGTSRSHDACREASARDRDYRGTARARDADDGVLAVCVDAGRGGCDGELQADHVQRLADNGPRDWTVWRCVKHHQEKTAAENTAKGGNVARGKEQNQHKGRGIYGVVATGGVVSVGYPLLVNWPPGVAVGAGAVYGAAAVGGGVLRSRRGRRREAISDLRTALARATHTVPDGLQVDHLRWKRGVPVAGRARYGGATNDARGSRERVAVEELLTRKAGRPCVFTWVPSRNRVLWRPRVAADGPAEAPAPSGAGLALPEGEVAARVRASLSAATKGDVLLTVEAAHPDGKPRVMVARYGEHVRDDSDDVRAALQGVVNAKAPGRWRADWDTAGNRVTFTRRPPMPAIVPAAPTPPHARGVWGPVPVGVDEDGATVCWDTDVTPHCLVVGSTGAGKSVVMANLILAVLARGADVALIDGKGTTLAGFRGLPGIRYVGLGEPQDMADAMDACETEMRFRYGQVRDRGAEPTGFRPLVIFLDEASNFAVSVDRWWKSEGKKAAESSARDAPALTAWGSIARLGREGRVFLVVGMQQAAASFFQGATESRDQLAGRIACGPLTEQGARMAFGRADVGRDLPVAAKGRATVDLGSGIKEVQTFWTPTPKPSGQVREEHEEVLRPLLDAIPPRVPVGRDATVVMAHGSVAPVRVDVEPPAPVAEVARPADLVRGDAVSWDGERRVVLSVDDDEDGVRVEFRLPGGGTEVVVFDGDILVERTD